MRTGEVMHAYNGSRAEPLATAIITAMPTACTVGHRLYLTLLVLSILGAACVSVWALTAGHEVTLPHRDPGRVYLRDKYGRRWSIDENEAPQALQRGFHQETEEEFTALVEEKQEQARSSLWGGALIWLLPLSIYGVNLWLRWLASPAPTPGPREPDNTRS